MSFKLEINCDNVAFEVCRVLGAKNATAIYATPTATPSAILSSKESARNEPEKH